MTTIELYDISKSTTLESNRSLFKYVSRMRRCWAKWISSVMPPTLLGPTALTLRSDLIENVKRSLCFRFNVWPWQLVAKMDTKVVCQSLETRKRYRFLAKKEIETLQAYTSDVCNTCPYKEIYLIR